MKNFFLPFFLFLIVFAGCKSDQDNKSRDINGKYLSQLVNSSIKGDVKANESLGSIINLKLPVNSNYNKLIVDSLNTRSGRKFYYVLLEYPNPVYNRFAVFDSALSLLLLDKSLNGFLSEENLKVDGLSFIKVNENFTSKDAVHLNRVSFYSIGDSSACLVFRTFTQMELDKNEFTQQINEISAERIKTSLKSSRYSPIRNKSDVFNFNSESNKYLSQNDIFDKYVIEIINKTKDKTNNPEIRDINSMWESVGIDPNAISNNPDADIKGGTGFSLSLSEDWKEFKNFSITQYLNREFKGTQYLNNIIGTTISVIEIPTANMAEDFIKYKLDKVQDGKIKMRYTDEIINDKIFIQFVEYSCGNRKFLLILKGSKFTYNDYKELYQKIINSFTMEC